MLTLSAAVAAISVMLAGTALAANPHFLQDSPHYEVEGHTVSASGSIAGLGRWDVTLVLTVEASQTVLCQNPGGKIAPGQTKHFQAEEKQTDIRVENGRVNFEISVDASPTLDPSLCPNPQWVPIGADVEIHSATLDVYQRGNLVLSDTQHF